jgi:hypothetical protein
VKRGGFTESSLKAWAEHGESLSGFAAIDNAFPRPRSTPMQRPQFSIGGLLVLISMLAVAFGALRSPSYLWANAIFSLAFGAIVIAVLNAIIGRGARRAYWFGFALCGAAYFLVSTVPGLRDSVCPRLVTEPIFDFVYPLVFPTPAPSTAPVAALSASDTILVDRAPTGRFIFRTSTPPTPVSRWAAWTETDRNIGVGYQIGTVSLVSSEAFRQIGHSLVTMLVSALGGLYARNRYQAWAAERPVEPAIRSERSE